MHIYSIYVWAFPVWAQAATAFLQRASDISDVPHYLSPQTFLRRNNGGYYDPPQDSAYLTIAPLRSLQR